MPGGKNHRSPSPMSSTNWRPIVESRFDAGIRLEFEEDGRLFQVKVEGPLVFNDGDLISEAALAGQG